MFRLPADSLWRERPFVLYWLARTVSVAGSTVTAVVLPLLVYRMTGSALATSLLAAIQVVPYLLFGLVAGAVADRFDRRRLMVGCDVTNAILLGTIPLAAGFGRLTVPHLYAVAILSATAFVWFDAANFGALPVLVGRNRLVAANSIVWSSETIVTIAGPSIGGLLAATLGPAQVVSIDALSYFASALILSLIPRAFTLAHAERVASASAFQRVSADIREGLTFVWSNALVRTLTLLGFGVSFSGGAMIGLMIVYGVEGLGLAKDDGRLGLLFAAGGIGSLAATMLLPRLTSRFSVGRITLAGLVCDLAFLLLVALAPSLIIGLPLLFLWHGSYTLVVLNGITARQIATPHHLQSRVNATARMIAWGGTPFGAAIGGAVADVVGVRPAITIMALGVATSLVVGWLSPLRAGHLTSAI